MRNRDALRQSSVRGSLGVDLLESLVVLVVEVARALLSDLDQLFAGGLEEAVERAHDADVEGLHGVFS